MGFRIRLGPFTFGPGGARLSFWRGGIGFSIPLSGKGRAFGKVGIGPLSWYSPSRKAKRPLPAEASSGAELDALAVGEMLALSAFRADQRFLERLQKQGMPWRGVQERLKEELPRELVELDDIAYRLVPKAMNAVFGRHGWRTEKRPSKSGTGSTTWIVVS